MEVWKPIHIKKYREKYSVSNLGNIKNAKTNYIFKQSSIRSGYKSVYLLDKSYKTHILVANAFLDPPNNSKKKWVNHIDGNKLNNKVSNLEWKTPGGNVKHAIDTGLLKPYERKVSQYNKNGELIKVFKSLKEAKIETGIDDGGIVKVCKGRRKTAGGYVWKYTEILEREQIDKNIPKRTKNIDNFPNYYVTDDGRIFSKRYNKYLKSWKNADGYLNVQLGNGNIKTKKTFLVHRLVAVAFIENSSNKISVNHKNKNRTDNRVENLEWATMSENNMHKYNYKQ